MKRPLYFCLLLFLIGASSCYKDLGNYDYERLPELQVEGILEDYGTKILYKDSLIIEPKITFGDEDESSFDAVWYELTDSLHPIARTLDLRILPNKSGESKYLLEIVHKTLGLSYRAKTQVIVTSGMERGLYVLKETPDGNTEVDGHIRKGVDEYELFSDMLSKQLGRPMPGKPVGLDYYDWSITDPVTGEYDRKRVLRPVSEKELLAFRMNDFSCQGHTEDFFFDVKEGDLHFESIKSSKEATVLVYNNGRVRTMPNDTRSDQQVSRFMMEYNGEYSLSPLIAGASRGSLVGYDVLTSSFRLMSGTSTSLFPTGDWYYGLVNFRPDFYRPMNNLNADLLMMGRTLVGTNNWDKSGTLFALISKNDQHNKRILYRIPLRTYAGNMQQRNASCVQKMDTLSSNLNLQKSKMFCMHEYEPRMFYTLGNRVFAYEISSKIEAPVITEASYPAGKVPEEITYLKYVRCLYDEEKYNFESLFVGGYLNGSYILMAFPLRGVEIVGEPVIWEGQGRIKDVRYTTPKCTDAEELYIWQ